METRIVFRLTRWALVVVTGFTGVAMLLYPGRTLLRPASPGYSFFENSLSDLGSTVAWSGQANRGFSFQLAASLILVLAGCACFVALIRVYSSSLIPRRLARAAGAFVLVAGAGMLGAALTPQDQYAPLHGRFTLFAVGSFPIATALLGLATALDGRFRRRVVIGWFALTSFVVAWTCVMLSAPPATDLQLAIPVTLQKLVAITLVATLVFQSFEAERVAEVDGNATKAAQANRRSRARDVTTRTADEGGLIAGAVEVPSISVIIPAFNEAGYIRETLDWLGAAERRLETIGHASVQILVVDNASTDRTADLAENAGATVMHESEHNVARVRNAGAAIALHDVLVFLDADTLIPPELLLRIARAMTDPQCVGGAVDCLHEANRMSVRAYLKFWRVLGLIGGMAQGACQFCRKDVFQELGGYDETWYMGEDVDFYWRLKRLAKGRGVGTLFIREFQVTPSPRRWNRWPLWRVLLWTNPLMTLALRRRRAPWSGWYLTPPR